MPDVTADPPALTCYSPVSETETEENQMVNTDPSRPARTRASTPKKLRRPEQQAAPFEAQWFA